MSQSQCPKCKSTNVDFEPATLVGLELIELQSGKNKYSYDCNDCKSYGTTWK